MTKKKAEGFSNAKNIGFLLRDNFSTWKVGDMLRDSIIEEFDSFGVAAEHYRKVTAKLLNDENVTEDLVKTASDVRDFVEISLEKIQDATRFYMTIFAKADPKLKASIIKSM